jgi:hypothetical protein
LAHSVFQHGSRDWLVVFGEMRPESFSVTPDGDLIAMEMADVAVLDKRHETSEQKK